MLIRWKPLVLVLVLAACAARGEAQVPGLSAPEAASGSSVIRGRITSRDTGKPLRRAEISLRTDGLLPGPPLTTNTSSDGRYELRDVPAGRYTLTVKRSGYLGLAFGQRRPGEQARPLEIADKEVLEKVDFALSRMSVIGGRVLDDLGEPIAGATVWVLQARYVRGRPLAATGANVRTDITGRYRLHSLVPGEYAVIATARETWPDDRDPKQVFGFAPTFFPGTSTSAQAKRVTLTAGQQASGIDFSLLSGRTSRLSGIATDVSGQPLDGASVSLLYEIGGPTTMMGSDVVVASTKATGDGAWTFSNIPPGEYRVSIRTTPRPNQPVQEGQLPIKVTGADLEGVPVVAGAGATVRGEVVTDDGSPLPPGFDRMQVRPPFDPHGRMVTSVLHPDNGRVRTDGSFEVQGVLSESLLSIGPLTGDWTLKAIEVEGRDISDLPLPAEHGQTLSGVRVVLTSRPTILRGALRDEKQNPAEGTVLVFPDDSAKWREGSRAIRTTRLDQRGWFTFKGLPAGDYLLVALESVQEGQWYDPQFLEASRGRARRVAIADAEAKQVDLVLGK